MLSINMMKIHWIMVLLSLCCTGAGGVTYQNIWRHLLSNYDRRLRPVSQAKEVIEVITNVHVDNIIALDAKSQTLSLKIWFTMMWKDTFLKFNATDIGIHRIAADAHDIWTPDIFLYESLDEESGGMIANSKQGYPLVNSTGHVLWIPPVITKSACHFEKTPPNNVSMQCREVRILCSRTLLTCSHSVTKRCSQKNTLCPLFVPTIRKPVQDYPFDIQVCNLTFGSWIYNIQSLRLKMDPNYSYTRETAHSGEWSVTPATCVVDPMDFGDQHEDSFDLIKCKLVLARKPLFYVFNLVIPCLLLLLIGSATFFLPVNCGEKVSLSITILLAMTVFMLVLMENLPPTSDAVPFLGKFIVSCSFLLAMSTAMAVSIVNLSSRGVTDVVSSPPPRWLQAFIINYVARLVCFNTHVIAKLKHTGHRISKQNRNVILHNSLQKQESEENDINGKDTSSTISPNLVSSESENNGSYEMWVVIALVLDRVYFIIYFILMMVEVIIASVMSAKTLSL